MMETISNDPAPKFHVPVHSIIHSMQKQHGIIPHQDYTQYRRYCTRRLDRLRHAKVGGREMLHGSGGRGKHASNFIPRKYLNKKAFEEKSSTTKTTDSTKTANSEEDVVAEESSEAATDYYDKVHHVNFLLIPLVSAERCWSFAMEIKAEYDEMKHANATKKPTTTLYKKKKHTSLGKLRKQFLLKLRKAAEYATSLENMAMNVSTTEVTMIECQAYASWMRGNAALERNRFEPAEQEYSNALKGIQVLKQLAANGSNLEMQIIFQAEQSTLLSPYELIAIMNCSNNNRASAIIRVTLPQLCRTLLVMLIWACLSCYNPNSNKRWTKHAVPKQAKQIASMEALFTVVLPSRWTAKIYV